nr:hypothetical protein L203_02469 [Cryptococcus depauperatus CBS 7841]
MLTFVLLIGLGFLLGTLAPIRSPTPAHYRYTTSAHHRYTTSPFLIHPSQFIKAPLPDRPGYLPHPVLPKKKGMLIPDSVHYVYGLKPVQEGQQGVELSYYAYLAMRSALINLRPKVIYFHYEHLPIGPWWELIRPHLTLIKTQVPESTYGRPLEHFAHKADVLRLLIMKYAGGIYLDVDVFVIKPFDDLLYFPTTIGMEASPDSRRHALDPEGLCNAIIISEPNAAFVDRWLASYATFDGSIWARHSVVKPWELARNYPTEIQVLSERAFFWPMWHGNEIQKTHETTAHDFKATGQYAYHAWESLAMGYLGTLSPKKIKNEENSFNRMVRAFIGPDDEETYRKWKGET